MQDLNLRPVASSSKTTSAKPIPTPASLDPWDFNYIPSPDGKDANLMIMFHGLGDVKESFTGLGKTLNLPSTAVLALQAPDRLPLIEEPGYVWYNTFGPMFEMLPLEQQTASTAIPKLRNLLTALTGPAFGWELSQIHLFGWVQGGTMALELAYDIGKNGLDVPSGPSGSMVKRKRFASVTTVCATLLSFPTSKMLLPTPVCYFTRQDLRASKPARELNLVRRAFKDVSVVEMPKPNSQNMPEGFSEWKGIMQFWSTVLVRADEGWKGEGEVYEVVQ